MTLVIPLPEEMREKERLRLEKLQEKLIQQQHQTRSKLANENFVARAPKELVEKTKEGLAQIETELASIGQKLSGLTQ